MSASDANWNNIFSTDVPGSTISVSNQPVSGIVLDLGDISNGNSGNNPGNGGNSGNSGNSGTLAGAKGKLTLTGFTEFNGKYVYSGLITKTGPKLLYGMNAAEIISGVSVMSLVQISNGRAEVPLYTLNAGATSVTDLYTPYEGNDEFSAVSILIVNDNDGKFTESEAASFATAYAGMIIGNYSNTGFTPRTNNGSIVIDRSDAKTMAEMMSDTSLLTTAKYILAVK
jgi:hypothetical protein